MTAPSLRSRVVLACLAVTVLSLVGAGLLVHRAVRDRLYAQLDANLRTVRLPLSPAAGAPAGVPTDARGTPAGNATNRPADPVVAIETRRPDGTVERRVAALFIDGTTDAPILPAVIAAPRDGGSASGPALFFDARGTTHRFRVKASSRDDGSQLLIALPLDDVTDTLAGLRRAQILVIALAAALAGAATLVLARVALRPLTRVERVAVAIAGGQRHQRVGLLPANTEVGRMAASFDAMVDELSAAMDRQSRTEAQLRQFVADAAHELRTPVAGVAAYAELIERGAADRPADLARAVTGIRTETTRVARLVDDLLVLARLDAPTTVPVAHAVNLAVLSGEAVDAARAIDPDRTIHLATDSHVFARGDPDLLRRVLDNLLANVRAHTPPTAACLVTVMSASPPDVARVSIADSGPGMSDADAARAFDRFWRSDQSRARATGAGAGFGLAIVRRAIESMHGTVTISQTPGGGLTVTVDLPNSQAPTSSGHPATEARVVEAPPA